MISQQLAMGGKLTVSSEKGKGVVIARMVFGGCDDLSFGRGSVALEGREK